LQIFFELFAFSFVLLFRYFAMVVFEVWVAKIIAFFGLCKFFSFFFHFFLMGLCVRLLYIYKVLDNVGQL